MKCLMKCNITSSYHKGGATCLRTDVDIWTTLNARENRQQQQIRKLCTIRKNAWTSEKVWGREVRYHPPSLGPDLPLAAFMFFVSMKNKLENDHNSDGKKQPEQKINPASGQGFLFCRRHRKTFTCVNK
ncbi:hypothetical protein NPIL_522511 [Nephila pilipes]|uniref:Uncharacterized protein n=1 Tax=Nephila pilipes TaxID=299642 RepID=A0A8X6UJD3_NEPPI|nr:hypothetical protein NPIL_522511 [Nephila pilipes]